jgi:hypothetical protein
LLSLKKAILNVDGKNAVFANFSLRARTVAIAKAIAIARATSSCTNS